jgi:hypothetical protein
VAVGIIAVGLGLVATGCAVSLGGLVLVGGVSGDAADSWGGRVWGGGCGGVLLDDPSRWSLTGMAGIGVSCRVAHSSVPVSSCWVGYSIVAIGCCRVDHRAVRVAACGLSGQWVPSG